MNRFAGVASTSKDAAARAAALRAALAEDGSPVMLLHLSPHVSIACSGDPALFGRTGPDNDTCMVFGACHGPAIPGAPAPRVDDPGAAAATLLSRRKLHGNGFLAGVAGSFVGAMYCDGDALLLFSDPGGARSLYFSEVPGVGLVFASHPLACARLAGPPALERSFEDFLLVYGFLPDGRTIYSGVRALAAGTALEWNAKTHTRALQLSGTTGGASSFRAPPHVQEELLESLHDELMECLQEQLPAHEDVGVLLGGFDSALVAAMLHRLGKRVTTYSFHYEAQEFNQPHTDTLARHLGITHRWVGITPEVVARGLRRYSLMAPQPTNWLNYVVQTVHVCERMREDGIRFAYSGDGCDAAFLGYPGTYKRTSIFARLPALRPAVTRTLLRLAAHKSLDRWLGHPYRMALNLLRATGRPMPSRAFLTFRVLDELSLDQLRTGDVPIQPEPMESTLQRLASPHAHTSLQRLGYAAKGLVSPNRTKLVAAADASGVQILSPYLHPRLKAFTLGIPDDLLRRQSQSGLGDPGKICLMRMAQQYRLLPDEVILQPKLAAIDGPIDSWFAVELRPLLDEMYDCLPFAADRRYLDSLVEPTPAEMLYKKYISSTRVISDAASLLATYASFNRHTNP